MTACKCTKCIFNCERFESRSHFNYSVGWVWSSGWSCSWIGLLLLTVTDVLTTCAVVIFRVLSSIPPPPPPPPQVVEMAVTVNNNSSMQDYLDDHTQPNYALSINTVLGRQKISGRGSRRTMKKGGKGEKKISRENYWWNPLLFLLCIFPSLSSYIFPLLVWYVCKICMK